MLRIPQASYQLLVIAGMLSGLQQFLKSRQEPISLGKDLGKISGRSLAKKASAVSTMTAE